MKRNRDQRVPENQKIQLQLCVSVELENGKIHEIDCVVMATGYRSDVRSWLKVVFYKQKAMIESVNRD